MTDPDIKKGLAGVTVDQRIRERFLEQLTDMGPDAAARLAELEGAVAERPAGDAGGGPSRPTRLQLLSVHDLEQEY